MGVLDNIEPREVFEHFEALSMVPRRTYRDEKIGAFCVEFAEKHGLDYVQDETGNVIIYKPGTAGYEDSEPVILQGHMDMVASKTLGSDHDFDSEPLDLFVDGNYIGARDTTLGADDGFALAFAMAVLASTDIPHPPIEAVFTVDEEIGMDGAHNLDVSLLKGRKIMNLDGEDEGCLTVGCAGAKILDAVIPFALSEAEGTAVTVKVRSYRGGHSGNDIQNQRGNAHKDMARILYTLSHDYDFRLKHIEGGSGANVIAKDCTADLIVCGGKAAEFADAIEKLGETIEAEYFGQEPDMSIKAEVGALEKCEAMDEDSTKRVIAFIYASPNGVQTMDRSIKGAVETSLNPGVVKTVDGAVRVSFQCRSSVDSKLDEMMERLTLCCELTGGYIDLISQYPAWPYKPESELRPLMVRVYKEMYGEEPECFASHGGLEGGILMGKNPDFDIVCFGPNLLGVHTPDERMDIESTGRTWEYLKAVLAACK